jgi:outer membrane immunogenic protein
MKTLILALIASTSIVGAARAADAVIGSAPEPAPVVASAAYDWSGFYVGAFGGASFGDYDYTLRDIIILDSDTESADGFLAGAQFGYDHQIGSFVVGGVADIAWANHEGGLDLTVEDPGPPVTVVDGNVTSELQYLGTVRLRAGFAADRLLIYAHGGYAFGETEITLSDGVDTLSLDKSRDGYVVGAGLEYAFSDNISLQGEYSFIDFGNEVAIRDAGVDLLEEELQFHTIKAGVNFRF